MANPQDQQATRVGVADITDYSDIDRPRSTKREDALASLGFKFRDHGQHPAEASAAPATNKEEQMFLEENAFQEAMPRVLAAMTKMKGEEADAS